MKKAILLCMLSALAITAHAYTYNYLCAITELSVDTLKSNTKNQFTLTWTQVCKNIAEYSSKPETTYTTTVKLVINSDDRTLEGTYTTEGASPTSSSANVNDQTINLVTSELYYGNTRRLLRTDSLSTFTIIKIDDTHYGITIGRLSFTAAALADRGKNTYNYNYCYAEAEILVQGIEPQPFVFSFNQGEDNADVFNYDMTVEGISIEKSNTGYGVDRYFLTLIGSGTSQETGKTHNYEIQLALYPNGESIAATYDTKDSEDILMASNSYVKDNNANKLRYLANDSLSSVRIEDKGEKQYRFFGGTLICVDLDANYSAVYGKKRIEAVHYYHFSDNAGEGIPFFWDPDAKTKELTANKLSVIQQWDGFQLIVQAQDEGLLAYEIVLELIGEQLDGTFSVSNDNLSLWSKVEHGTTTSYITDGAEVSISQKSAGVYTISATLPCENENTYVLNDFDFEYSDSPTGVVDVQGDKVQGTKVLRNGVLYLMYDGQMYDVRGRKVK